MAGGGSVVVVGGGGGTPGGSSGQIQYNNSGAFGGIALGANNTVLTSNGSSASFVAPTGGSGALVLLEQHAAATSATLDFTSFISSSYDDYIFKFVDIIPTSGSGANFFINVGTGATPTYQTGAYSYEVLRIVASTQVASGDTTGTATNLVLNSTAETVNHGSPANWGFNGSLELFNPQSAIFKEMVWDCNYLGSSGSKFRLVGAGTYEAGTVLTAIRFKFDTGSISSGTIRVYGVAKS